MPLDNTLKLIGDIFVDMDIGKNTRGHQLSTAVAIHPLCNVYPMRCECGNDLDFEYVARITVKQSQTIEGAVELSLGTTKVQVTNETIVRCCECGGYDLFYSMVERYKRHNLPPKK